MTCLSCIDARKRAAWRRAGVLTAVLAAAVVCDRARAADMSDDDILRGSFISDASPGYVRWDGLQAGVHAGYSNMNADFGNSSSGQVAYILRNTTIENEMHPSDWTTLPSDTTNSSQYGLFIGYNVQWDQLVLGFDLAYNRMASAEASASDSLGRQFSTSDGYQNQVTVSAQSSVKLIDYATFRARAGYAFGQFLPYAMIGAAVGRFNYSTTSTVHASGQPAAGGGGLPFDNTNTLTDGKNNAYAAGFVGGLGMDVAVLPNVFVRAEWEYVAFSPVNGIRANLNTGRVGAGVRF
ncbi:MAG TPA: outer membrane beta-barrel protein [Pseudolabrys sp.]|jgi:opacity protein-like surface antigen|nr:outer membrane beta-barrel protein [Pseudolabrys sp.]